MQEFFRSTRVLPVFLRNAGELGGWMDVQTGLSSFGAREPVRERCQALTLQQKKLPVSGPPFEAPPPGRLKIQMVMITNLRPF